MKLKAHSNGFIYAHFSNGNPVSLKTKDMKEAKQFAADLNLEAMEQAKKLGALTASVVQSLGSVKKISVDSAIEQYIEAMAVDGYRATSISRSRSTLRCWSRAMKVGNMQVATLERRHLDPWVNPLNATKYNSRLKNHAVLLAFFKYCTHQGLLIWNPALQIKVRREGLTQGQLVTKETQPFTEDEVKRIIASQEPGSFWHFATILAYHTGLRMGDIAKLEWTNIRGERIVVATSKTMIEVAHVMHPDVKAALSKVEKGSSNYLFPDKAATVLTATSAQSTMSHQFQRICARLGIEGKHFHGLRHTFALRKKQEEKRRIFQEMLDQLSTKGVMQQLGHTSPATTRIYLSHGNK